jgi:hypothetical protein
MHGASIVWSTNQASDSEVEYGPTPAYGGLSFDVAMVTEHVRTLTGLEPGTTYYFRVRSRNAQNQAATSATFVFTTTPLPAPDPGPPPQEADPPVQQVIGRRPVRGQAKGQFVGDGGGDTTVVKPAAQAAMKGGEPEVKDASPVALPLPVAPPLPAAAPTTSSRTARETPCVTPDPFAGIPGLVGVCQRGIWVPTRR